MPPDSGRPYDVVLFGATGFTGGLAARYLAAHAPPSCRWALAGRDWDKLEAVRARLARIDSACGGLPLLAADLAQAGSLREIAESTRVIITTVGPYTVHGEPLVAACAEAGTDYVDITGEPEFIDRMFAAHHARAVATGARLVHACGFESVPHDLGVLYTVGMLPDGVPLRIDGFVQAHGGVSGGTLATVLTSLSRPAAMREAAKARRRLDPHPSGRRVSIPHGLPYRDDRVRAWAVPLPTVDAQVVGRSAAALDRYGPDFRYRHFVAVRHLPLAVAGIATAAGAAALAQLPPVRRLLGRLRAPGQGPSERQRARSWFSVRFVGRGGGEEVVTEVSGGDPGYDETAKMLAEAALCLAFDPLPATSGQVTTAVAMGQALIDRLVAAGLRFRVV